MIVARKVIIIGAGIGGIASASLLAKAGFNVHVYEKDSMAGGRAGVLKKDGFTFDTGPSWYLMPDVFEHYFNLMGESAAALMDLKRLNPAYKVFFEKADPITISGSLKKDARTFEKIEAGAGAALSKYVAKSRVIYDLSIDHFLYTNFEKLTDLTHRDILKHLPELPGLLLRPIDSYVRSFVKNRQLTQVLEYPMVFLGTSPFSAPAMYSLMSALDFDEGVYYPKGGMYQIIENMVSVAEKNGVTIHLDSPVSNIIVKDSQAVGIKLKGGDSIYADIVVSNADLHYTETQLLAPQHQTFPESYWTSKESGPSALLLYLGVKGSVPEFEHHNLLFVDDWKKNFNAIYKTKTIPKKASIYVSKTSQTDNVSPKGSETLFVLVPLPTGLKLNTREANELADHYIAQIEAMTGVKLADRLTVKELFKPSDFEKKFNSWQSSMLGQSHLLRQSAFFRTPNKSKKVQDLYYVGGSTVPGIGLPMCLIGAELVYKRIAGDKKGGRVDEIRQMGSA